MWSPLWYHLHYMFLHISSLLTSFFPSFRLHPLIYPSIHPSLLPPSSLSLWLCTMHPNDPPKPVKRCLWVRFTHPHSLCFASLYDGKAQNTFAVSAADCGISSSAGAVCHQQNRRSGCIGDRIFTACWKHCCCSFGPVPMRNYSELIAILLGRR